MTKPTRTPADKAALKACAEALAAEIEARAALLRAQASLRGATLSRYQSLTAAIREMAA